jgi:uncharacterized protein with HEPN domain
MLRSNIKPEDIIGMRNRLIHAYFAVNLDIVWSTPTEDVPPLIAELKRLLGNVP